MSPTTDPILDYPLEIHRKIDRQWRRRVAAVSDGRAKDPAGAARCALCHEAASVAPIGSTYLGAGVIRHHWLCTPCGHVWSTEVRLPG